MSGNLAREHPAVGPRDAQPRDHLRAVEETELPPVVRRLADEYDSRVGERDRFLWKWIHNLFDAFTLSSVPDEDWEAVKVTKTLLTMYVTVLDDVADRHGDAETFEQARRLPFAPGAVDPEAPGVDAEVVRFAREVWAQIEARLGTAPRHDEFAELFAFDLRSVLQAMEYARLVNDRPAMANLAGTRHYGPHNMVMFPYAGIDLMHSPGFDRAELGALRSLLFDLQRMARIGNWLTTWERELGEDDYSAGVVVAAVERDVIDPCDDATPARQAARVREAGVHDEFRQEWRDRYDAALARDVEVSTVDTARLVRGMRTVMDHHVASHGLK